jgi:hypothetical protein
MLEITITKLKNSYRSSTVDSNRRKYQWCQDKPFEIIESEGKKVKGMKKLKRFYGTPSNKPIYVLG